MKQLFFVLLTFAILFLSVGVLQWLEKRGIVKPGTTKSLVAYDASNPRDRSMGIRVVIALLITLVLIAGLAVFYMKPQLR